MAAAPPLEARFRKTVANPLSIELTERRTGPPGGGAPVTGMESSFAKFDHIQFKRGLGTDGASPVGRTSRAFQNPLSTPETGPQGALSPLSAAPRVSGIASQLQRSTLFQRRRLSPVKGGASTKRKSSFFGGGGTVPVKGGSYGSPRMVSSVAMSAFTGMSTIGMVMPVFHEIPEASSDEYETDTESDSDGEFEEDVAIDMDL